MRHNEKKYISKLKSALPNIKLVGNVAEKGKNMNKSLLSKPSFQMPKTINA